MQPYFPPRLSDTHFYSNIIKLSSFFLDHTCPVVELIEIMSDNRKGIRILVVDDEPEVHAVLGRMLAHAGYSVDAAYSAEEAYKAIEKHKPDVVLLDIMMPSVSGIEVCNKLRADEGTKDIIILIVSARDAQSDRIEGLSHGADDYISKPFHLKSLMRKIEHMLDKRDKKKFREQIT
jgi:DNA-binding response OmpR family regulator